MKLRSLYLRPHSSGGLLCALLIAGHAYGADPASDLQRLQIDRDRQQMELRLRMQQQQERALSPTRDPIAEQRRGALEREQVQRQQQLFDEDARASVVLQPTEDAASAARRDIQRQQAEQRALEQAQRFEIERREK